MILIYYNQALSNLITDRVNQSAQSCYFFKTPASKAPDSIARRKSSSRLNQSFEDPTASSRAKSAYPDSPYEPGKYGPMSVEHLSLHSRCQVQPGSRRGEIAFIGVINELGGGDYWIGVILDEPLGKTDGIVSSSGVRYFEAPGPNRGGFFRGKNVEVGDYPKIDVTDEFVSNENDFLP